MPKNLNHSKRTLKPSSPKSEIEECPPKDIPQKWRPKQPSQKEAFIGRHLSEAVVGALAGGVAVHQTMKKTITDLEERLGGMESSLAETEKTLKKQAEDRKTEKKAEDAVKAFDSRLNLDASFLSNFNGNHGPQY